MIRKFVYNKIFRTTGMLILLLLLLLFPAAKEYSLDDTNTKQTIREDYKSEVYLLDKNDFVARCSVNILNTNDDEYLKKIFELLVIDGKYTDAIPNGFKPLLPTDTTLNSLVIDNDAVIIDISDDIKEVSADKEEKMLELITYNMTLLPQINKVYINVNGKSLEKLYNSNKMVRQPLSRKLGVNKEHNETTYKNMSYTTIYYASKNNNGYYYVPVTLINNDSSEKIKIIVNELTSSSVYEPNLMSLLNYNVKLNNYKIEDDVMSIDFNNYIFDDLSSKKILEEVIYSLSLSIRDNYDVNYVVFSVDGKKITKSSIKNLE